MLSIPRYLGSLTKGGDGATTVEYGLMLALIAGVVLVALLVFGQAVLALFFGAVAAGL